MANIAEDLAKILSSRYGKDVRQAIHDSIYDINEIAEGQEAKILEHTKNSEAWAVGTKNGTEVPALEPQYQNNSKYYAIEAHKEYTNTVEAADNAETSANNASNSANASNNSAVRSQSWAVGGTNTRSNEDTNNSYYWSTQAEYWYNQARSIAESFGGALRPMGTVAFENLPSLDSASPGDMYNISNSFVTTEEFVGGAGIEVDAGSSVYKTTGGLWDVLANYSQTEINDIIAGALINIDEFE